MPSSSGEGDYLCPINFHPASISSCISPGENRKRLFRKRAAACRRPEPALSQLYKATPCSQVCRAALTSGFLLSPLPGSPPALSPVPWWWACGCSEFRAVQTGGGCSLIGSWHHLFGADLSLKFMEMIFLLKWPRLARAARAARCGMVLQKSCCHEESR